MDTREQLYKIDTTGKIRVWWLEFDREKYRAHSGILDGAIVESGWKYAERKNIGKANVTTVAEQVIIEVNAEYEKKMYQGKYHPSLEESEGGAKFAEAMLAQKYDVKKSKNFPYISNPKLDGVRCLTTKTTMHSRNGKAFVSSPHIQKQLAKFFEKFPDVILDGELYNHDLKNDFEKIISLARKTKPTNEDLIESAKMVQYHVYDIITPTPMTYTERYTFLTENLVGDCDSVFIVKSKICNSADEAGSLLSEYLESGYEGQMLRVDEMPYEHKRSKSLLKHKVMNDGEYEIVDILEGIGNYAGMAKALVIRLPDGSTQKSGMRGKQDYLTNLLVNKDKYIGGQATILYQDKTSDDKLRFPVAKTLFEGVRDV